MSTPSASDSTASVISSLSNSFRKIPSSAIPALLDCVLASTGLSPSSVFDSLLNTFPILNEEEEKLCLEECCFMASLVGALCHLLKKIGPTRESVQLFLCRSFLPAIKMAHKLDRELLNQIAEMFVDAVIEANLWRILETTLVPFFLRAICLSLGVNMNEISHMFQWSNCMVAQCSVRLLNVPEVDGDTQSFQLSVSCQVLALILDVSLRGHLVTSTSQLGADNSSPFGDIYSGNLLWDLCNLAEHLLLHGSEHRSCTVVFLLPTIFKTFINRDVFEVSVQGKTHILLRSYLFRRIWNCCRRLFSLGPLERRDAYNILSLYTSYFSFQSDVDAEMSNGVKSDDVISDKEFWDEIKRGLVDNDALVRKQSLQILKTILNISGGTQSHSDIFEKDSQNNHSNHSGMSKRDFWADKEAKSLGLGSFCSSANPILNFQQQWEAFVLLYEMLEEYGTHLVEAAWNHQVSLLLQCSSFDDKLLSSFGEELQGSQTKASGEFFTWLPILWERGFNHDNPLVRCLIMQSFTAIEWKNCGNFTKSLPEAFVCGPFMQGLNNPVHHDDFGLKRIYSSRTMKGATHFLHEYTRYLNAREMVAFLIKLASLVKTQSFSRAGLMSLAECIASAACGIKKYRDSGPEFCEDASFKNSHANLPSDSEFTGDITKLLESFRFVVESSKQHFNPRYRLQVCERVLDSAVSTVCLSDVPLKAVLHFISAIPWEFTNTSGCLRKKIQDWASAWVKKQCGPHSFAVEKKLLKSLQDFPTSFISNHTVGESLVTYDDEELDAWVSETKIWARVLFLIVKEETHLEPIVEFIRHVGSNLCNQESELDCVSSKFLILIMSLVHELQMLQETVVSYDRKRKVESEGGLHWEVNEFISTGASSIYEKFATVFCSIMDELVSFANMSSSVFWSENHTEETFLPGSIRGRLGGPSQRRLPSSTTSVVLQAIVSLKTVALISSWCAQFRSTVALSSAFTCLWKFFWKTISSPCYDTQEIGAEKRLAAYEALAPVLKALVSEFCVSVLDKIKIETIMLPTKVGGEPMFDSLVVSFLQNINSLLAVGVLARSRYAVLLNWKWICLESLLLFPYRFIENGYQLRDGNVFLSGVVLRSLFSELVDSLENAGEGSILSMLRSVRLILGLYSSGMLSSGDSSCNELDVQMMWDLVHSSWILHVNCNKRRVAPIAALLSAILHPSVFADESMHVRESEPGPLKWFIEKVLEECTKSPRTIRLAALHLTGLWLSYPKTLKYYMKELKLLSLYGSVAFDEDFEGELSGNLDARSEVSLLARSPDPDLTEEFINTELYARVSVSVLFHKLADLADMVGTTDQLDICHAATEAGKIFLLELLDSVVNDKDLSKDLYKKYSAIHRRKIRAWQMICVLSRFSSQDILGQVTDSLHISLYRNNLPAVRQYLETFAINIFLKFPFMVEGQLLPILRNYDMKPQALASYVYIAANVILHSPEVAQARHMDVLLPPIIPLLTSHHHSLRGFTQLLVHHVLCKLYPSPESGITDTLLLEKRCFEDLKLYLAKNSDCMRLRASMERYLTAYDPHISVTPAGIFINRVEEVEFECVPTSLMDRVLSFLNDARDDLRSSMAKDAVAVKNETLKIAENSNGMETWSKVDSERFFNRPQDFQKKITPKHEKHDNSSTPLFSNIDTYKQLADMEREDQLFDHLLCSIGVATEKERASRQSFILVASLIDRIPNLAGLARTCEVFKASGLAIADASILHDKQFQLISVTAEKWVPITELPVNSVKTFLEKKKRQGFSVLGLEQTANSIPLDQYAFPEKTVLILGHEKEGIPVDIIHILDACIEIPQLGVVRSLNVHVSGAIALWEYTRQQRSH